MAIVIGDPWQARDSAARSPRRLRERAAAAGIRNFSATMLADNRPARSLMRTISRRLDEGAVSGGVREVVAELAV